MSSVNEYPPTPVANVPDVSDNPSYEIVGGDLAGGIVFVCDHARNTVPEALKSLGLDKRQFERHIAYDIGVADLTRQLAGQLGVPAVLSKFSRLVIDPNRGVLDPTLIMRLSDGAIVPGNARLSDAEIEARRVMLYDPYHHAIEDVLETARRREIFPVVISIHSFTPVWKGVERPWHVGILWDKDPRFAKPLIETLIQQGDIVVGNNQPYRGWLDGDSMHRHGTRRGLAHALVEVRQDLIGDASGIEEWCDRLVQAIQSAMTSKDLHKIIHYGSHSD